MTKLESVTLVTKAIKQEKWEIITARKIISKLYENFCQSGSAEEELDRSGRPKNDQNEVKQGKTILCENTHSSLTKISSLTNVI